MIIKYISILLVITIIALIVNIIEDHNRKKKAIKVTLSKSKLMLLTCLHQGKELNFLVDSGANNNFISPKTAESLNAELKHNKQELVGLGDMSTSHSIKIDFTIKKYKFTQDFLVADIPALTELTNFFEKPIHGILGCGFLSENKTILNYNSETMSFNI